MSEPVFANGSCRCGATRYVIRGEPVLMAQCHCVDCQKASGTGHMSLAFFKEQDVEIAGEPVAYAVNTDSGNQKIFHFCPTCGSRLHGRNTGRPGITVIPVGCLDDTSWFRPQSVVYTKYRQKWDITSEKVPNFEEMPPPRK
ncbi:MAG: GFA family protein [Gammaproteobacteria bacterium]